MFNALEQNLTEGHRLELLANAYRDVAKWTKEGNARFARMSSSDVRLVPKDGETISHSTKRLKPFTEVAFTKRSTQEQRRRSVEKGDPKDVPASLIPARTKQKPREVAPAHRLRQLAEKEKKSKQAAAEKEARRKELEKRFLEYHKNVMAFKQRKSATASKKEVG